MLSKPEIPTPCLDKLEAAIKAAEERGASVEEMMVYQSSIPLAATTDAMAEMVRQKIEVF